VKHVAPVLISQWPDFWLGRLTCKIVSKMTYNVSSGTLNPTIPYLTWFLCHCMVQFLLMKVISYF